MQYLVGLSSRNYKVIEHKWSDIVYIDKIAKRWLIIDIAFPRDKNIIVKNQEKINKY